MRVVGSRVVRVGGPFAGRAFAGTRAVDVRRGVYLELRADDGRTGWGEGSPLAGFHLESVDEVAASLAGIHERIGDLDLERAPVERIARAARSLARSAALFALETALLDLAAQSKNIDVAGLLGGESARQTCAVSAFAGELGEPGALVKADRAREIGITAIKLKARGSDLERESRAIAELRREAPGIRIRLDLNGGLQLDAARAALRAYGRAGIQLVEEPTRGRALLELGAHGAPWFADETLADMGIREALVSAPGCAGLVLKPALLGMFEARRLALMAFEAGKSVIVTHMFDGPVALAAACELALSLPKDPLASGLAPHDALAAFPPCVAPHLGRSSNAACRTGRAGLGVSPLEAR